MSTPEEPPQLTRRKLRELRDTAATPIITGPPEPAETPVVAPLPRAAEPISLPEPPVQPEQPAAETAPDDAPALTRREARQRERLRTASVPVLSAEDIDAAAAGVPYDAAAVQEPEAASAEIVDAAIVGEPDVAAAAVPSDADDGAAPEEAHVEAEPATPDDVGSATQAAEPQTGQEPDAEVEDPATAEADEKAAETEHRLVTPQLGAELLAGQASEVEVPASFDQLLTRSSAATGALSMPNALILSQTPDGGSLVSPVTATGEVLITGTFTLPDTYGSTGSVPGSADGKEVDAVLVDGELPAASSPTPIAASAAISTIKSADEIIRPPAPEKGSRLMVVLAITAGVLAVALAGVLILAITTGLL